MHAKALTSRGIGFLLSLLLTIATYYLITRPDIFHLNAVGAVKAILILAAIQASVQVVFFLDVWCEKPPFWNTNFFIATLSIIAIIILFTFWIMNNLNSNMMPS